MNKLIEHALQLQQNQQVNESIAIFEKVLAQQPQQADALHGLGLAYAQKNNLSKAITYLSQAVQSAPQVSGFHNNLGNAYKKSGKLDLAKVHFQQALKLKTPYSEAHNNLGSVFYLQGKIDDAIKQFQKALRINPSLWNAHYNLGNCYIKHDRFIDACPHYEETLKYRPDHIGALNNLGISYCLLKNFEQAKTLLSQVVQREPSNIDALFHLGITQASLGELESAKKCYLQILSIHSEHDQAHHNLATLYLHLNDKSSALQHYQKAYAINPLNQTAQHMSQALQGKTLKEGAPYEYTRALFDQYAYSYDQHVSEKLQYQVPKLLRAMLTTVVQQKNTPWNVLDLGCGTGLCAPYFIDVADKLYGVDLSPKMVDVAAQKEAYYKLAVSDIIDYLSKTNVIFDLIIAADVFVYFGDVKPVFELIHKNLKTHGYFTFSVEKLIDSTENYLITETGRYRHTDDYIKSLCETLGFELISEQEQTIRHQEERPITGLLYLVQKNNS
tara:strand:+ start:91209 stop:92708 length:1500 start_codon:yes stop_codon:yes gene_type:complete